MRDWLAKLVQFIEELGFDTEGLSREQLLYRRRRAYAHECGHAAVAWLSPAVVSIPGITFRRYGERAAQTAIQFLPGHPDYLIENALVTLGGLAGEVLVWKRVRSGGFADDLPMALEALTKFLERSTVGSIRRRWKDSLADSGLDVAAMMSQRPPADLAEALNLCFRRAKRLLQDNRAGFDRLVALAERKGDLTHDDIASQFGPRPWAPTHPH